MKNREKTIKKLSHWSLDSWFKKHRRARTLKNLSLIGALVAIAFTGFWIFNHYDWVTAEYTQNEVVDDTITESFTAEILSGDEWTINTDLENIDVEFIVVSGDDFVVKHTYFEDDKFEYNFNFETNILTLENDTDNGISFFWDPSQLFKIINNRNVIRIEIPVDLVIEDVDLDTTNGVVTVRNIDFDSLNIQTSNGRVNVINVNTETLMTLSSSNSKITVTSSTVGSSLKIVTSNGGIELGDVIVDNDVSAITSNGRIQVNNVITNNAGDMVLKSTNNKIDVVNTNFVNYSFTTSNANIDLEDINTNLLPGAELVVRTSNGSINVEDAYASDVTMDTSNGDISYMNADANYHPASLDLDTSSDDDINTNVTD